MSDIEEYPGAEEQIRDYLRIRDKGRDLELTNPTFCLDLVPALEQWLPDAHARTPEAQARQAIEELLRKQVGMEPGYIGAEVGFEAFKRDFDPSEDFLKQWIPVIARLSESVDYRLCHVRLEAPELRPYQLHWDMMEKIDAVNAAAEEWKKRKNIK